jgi:hypothetical protein
MNECLGEHLCGEADVLECLVLAPAGHDVGEGTEGILEEGRLQQSEIKIKTKPETRTTYDWDTYSLRSKNFLNAMRIRFHVFN